MGAAANMAQVNIRMEPELKAKMDAVLESIGYTSTMFVREIAYTLAEGRGGLERICRAIAERPVEEDTATGEDRGLAYLRSIEDSRLRLYLGLGLDPSNLPAFPPHMSDAELMDAYYDEREQERRDNYVA